MCHWTFVDTSPQIYLKEICNSYFTYSYSGMRSIERNISFNNKNGPEYLVKSLAKQMMLKHSDTKSMFLSKCLEPSQTKKFNSFRCKSGLTLYMSIVTAWKRLLCRQGSSACPYRSSYVPKWCVNKVRRSRSWARSTFLLFDDLQKCHIEWQ